MRTTDDEFARRLTGFGLSEKEASVYVHLLKYGPNTQSRLAKSLETYREDVRRTLNSLIRKGMVLPSPDGDAIYTAVDLDAALDHAVKKQESELLEMEARKQELKELAKQQRFRLSGEVSTFKIPKGPRD
jgi:HTH-type transcriptional regulator, sugar sensing transcriptional regulator